MIETTLKKERRKVNYYEKESNSYSETKQEELELKVNT